VSAVAIIDGGGANIASLRFALERLGVESVLTSDAESIRAARHVILPGVGAARAAMAKLRDAGLDRLIPRLTQPVLGICLGMQLLCDASAEDSVDCLGIVPGTAQRFAAAAGQPVPHMGWNQLQKARDVPLLADVPEDAYCYYVHSYALPVGAATLATCDYGSPFTAVLGRDNFLGVQFHPERSGPVGATILRNFLTRY
jgi:imidazole glycerol-phosphate synthase subunit HisH